MAQLSSLTKLFVKISDNLTEEEVRNLKSLISLEEVLGKAKIEKATTLEILDMLVDNKTIGRGNLGFLVQVLRSLGKGKLAEETEGLEQEQKMEGIETQDTACATHPSVETDDSGSGDSKGDKSETATTELKEATPAFKRASGTLVSCDDQKTVAQEVTSELASLHIKELERLWEEPRQTPGSGPGDSNTDDRDAENRLKTLLTEVNTSAVAGDKERQFDLLCQVGDLYRTKLHNLQSALQYYQKMLDCSKSLTTDQKQAKAQNRLGLTYDILGIQQEAIRSHERALDIYTSTANRETELCIAYKNLASSLALSRQVLDAKSSYESALNVAMETGNKQEQMDIYCKLGDLHREQLHEPQVSHKYYTEMLALARELEIKAMDGEACGRLGLACSAMHEYEAALEWRQKALKVKQDLGDKKEEITAHINLGNTYRRLGNVDQATLHFNTALQMAQQTGDQYRQMRVYLWMGDMQREQLHSPRTSIQYYEQSLALARQLGDRRQEGWAYIRLGLARHDIGENETALELYKGFLKMSKESEDKTAQISAHQNIAGFYKALGKLDQARSHYQSALTIAMETGNKQEQMDIYLGLGELHREQLHKPQESHKYYTEMLAQAKDLGRKDKERLAYNRLGNAHYDMGEYEKALGWYEKDLKMSQEDGDKTEQITAHQCIAVSYKALGKPDQARSHYQSALTLAMETVNKQEQEDITKSLANL